MKKEKINSINLQRLIALKTDNIDFEDVTDEQIDSITELSLFGKTLDGRNSGIDLEETLNLFKGLQELAVSDFMITENVAERITELEELCCLEIVNCGFALQDFSSVLKQVPQVKLVSCKEIPFVVTGQEVVDIEGCNVDFTKLDLTGVRVLKLYGCDVANIEDILENDTLEVVSLDGSTLRTAEDEEVINIEVPKGCRYSHRDDITRVEDGEERN